VGPRDRPHLTPQRLPPPLAHPQRAPCRDRVLDRAHLQPAPTSASPRQAHPGRVRARPHRPARRYRGMINTHPVSTDPAAVPWMDDRPVCRPLPPGPCVPPAQCARPAWCAPWPTKSTGHVGRAHHQGARRRPIGATPARRRRAPVHGRERPSEDQAADRSTGQLDPTSHTGVALQLLRMNPRTYSTPIITTVHPKRRHKMRCRGVMSGFVIPISSILNCLEDCSLF
jgi:hypothetical protein